MEHKEEINIQPIQKEETRIQKNKNSIRRPWDTSKHANIPIIGVPDREENEQDSGNTSEKMTEKFPNMVKETDIQVQEAENPKQDGGKEAHSKAHHN